MVCKRKKFSGSRGRAFSFHLCIVGRCLAPWVRNPHRWLATLALLVSALGGARSMADPPSAGDLFNTLKNNLLGKATREPGSIGAFDSRLNRLLSGSPPSGARDPEWPRVAISDIRIPPRMLAASKRGTDLGAAAFERDVRQTMTPSDCFYFTATIWGDPEHSELLKNVSLCGADLSKLKDAAGGRPTGIDEGKFLVYSTGYTPGETTGHARTLGPNPPKDLIAEKDYSGPAVAKGNGIGAWFINATAILVGFDPSYDRRRLWFVNFKDS